LRGKLESAEAEVARLRALAATAATAVEKPMVRVVDQPLVNESKSRRQGGNKTGGQEGKVSQTSQTVAPHVGDGLHAARPAATDGVETKVAVDQSRVFGAEEPASQTPASVADSVPKKTDDPVDTVRSAAPIASSAAGTDVAADVATDAHTSASSGTASGARAPQTTTTVIGATYVLYLRGCAVVPRT